MLHKVQRLWIKKLVYGWLIFCVGGVGSLTYFDGLMPGHEHGQHPFHLSIFEESSHGHHHELHQPKAKTEIGLIRLWFIRNLNAQADFILAAQNLSPGLSQFFVSGLSSGYLVPIAQFRFFTFPSLLGSTALVALSGQSASLAPHDKPPSFLLN